MLAISPGSPVENHWERLVAWVNRITGEAPEWDERVLEPLK